MIEISGLETSTARICPYPMKVVLGVYPAGLSEDPLSEKLT